MESNRMTTLWYQKNGQFATFNPILTWKHAIIQHLQQSNKDFPVQVGQQISKTIVPVISGENHVKKLAVHFFNSPARILEQKNEVWSPTIYCCHMCAPLDYRYIVFPSISYFNFVFFFRIL